MLIYDIMKTIDYSPINENTFIIVNESNDGSFKLFHNGELIYNSLPTLNIEFLNVAFSHDGSNIIFLQHLHSGQRINIVPLNAILLNNIDQASIFRFNTDYKILDFIVSTNSNQIAILFQTNAYYNNSITGVSNIHAANRFDFFLNVYDFTNNRLLFERIYGRPIKFSISEIDTIAITSHVVDHYEGINSFEIDIFDVITENRLNLFYEYEIQFIQYIPEIEPNYNKLLVITREPGNIQNIKILNIEDNFREIYNKNIDGYIVKTVNVTRNGQIAIGTQTGLIYFSSLEEDQIPQLLFDNLSITNIIFSQTGNKIKVAYIEYDDMIDEEYLSIGHHNLIEPDEYIPIEDVHQYEPIQLGQEDQGQWEQWEEEEEDIVIDDPELDACFIPPTNPQKLQLYGNQNCFDVIQMNEENIGQYLSADRDNIVIFYKQPTDVDFLATCLTFTALKKYLKDPKHAFYSCEDGKDLRTYYTQPPEFLKIPTQSHTIFVSYQDIKQKYIQRQNMIFLEFNERVETTITYEASITMNFVSCNHCQKGSIINVYRIIF
jgi:hypothetical protein